MISNSSNHRIPRAALRTARHRLAGHALTNKNPVKYSSCILALASLEDGERHANKWNMTDSTHTFSSGYFSSSLFYALLKFLVYNRVRFSSLLNMVTRVCLNQTWKTVFSQFLLQHILFPIKILKPSSENCALLPIYRYLLSFSAP